MRLCFIDVETTGLDLDQHELIEVGLVQVCPKTLDVQSMQSVRIQPRHIERADPKALQINGYSEAAWRGALPLKVALQRIGAQLEGAALAGHNVAFDWSFLSKSFDAVGLERPAVHHRRLDTVSLAWPLLVSGRVRSLSLDSVCAHFGIRRGAPHRALDDALASLKAARRLLSYSALGLQLGDLCAPTHCDCVEGACVVKSDASQVKECTKPTGKPVECCSSERLCNAIIHPVQKVDSTKTPLGASAVRRRRVYVCHAFGEDPRGHAQQIQQICRELVADGMLPIAPQLYLPAFVREQGERALAMSLCLELLASCDELRVYGARMTEGMWTELEHARLRSIPVCFANGGGR